MTLVLGICLLLCLVGCGSNNAGETTSPVETTVPPTTLPDPSKLHADAQRALEKHTNLVVSYNLEHQRTIGGESYSYSNVGSASYTGLGTDDFSALISENLAFGTYETQHIRSFLSGKGYVRVNNCNFSCELTAADFLAQQLPAVLLSDGLYADVRLEVSDTGIVISFAAPQQLESWLNVDSRAVIVNAYGSVTLDSSNHMTAAFYHAEYTLGNTVHTVDVATTISTPEELDLSTSQPVYPEECIAVNDLTIPAKLLQVVGDVYGTKAMTVSYNDRLYSAAFTSIRTQTGAFDTYGAGDDFLCSMDTQVNVTDYAGTTVSKSQSISYIDGVYAVTTNGGDPTSAEVSAEDIRIMCEDAILASLFEFDCMAEASMTQEGDFLYINFVGNETYTEAMCDSIYAMYDVDLDSLAGSYTTPAAGGYLVINVHTGLPTALGMNVERTHTIDGVPYELTYQLDQSMELASDLAHENITGQIAPEEDVLETATPLFYKVTGEDGKTLWLLGTIHVGDEHTGALPYQVNDAFQAADALAVELDSIAFAESMQTDAALQGQLAELYYYSDNTTVSKHLSEDLYSQLKKLTLASGNNSVNAPYIKASIWSSLIENFYLQQGTDLSSSKGVDMRLLKLAKSQEKTIYEIESGLSQYKLLSGFSDTVQSKLLEETLNTGILGYCQDVAELYELWCQGDEAMLTQYFTSGNEELSDAEAEYQKAMITDRNKAMLKAACKYLESDETVFYAVGLAHLLGEDGLVESLREKGYTVELVTYE